MFKDEPRSDISPSSNPTPPRSAAERWSSCRTVSRRSLPEAEFMDPEVFKAQMEAMTRKGDGEQVIVKPTLSEAERMYPGSYLAHLEAMLQEEDRRQAKTRRPPREAQFMDSVRQVFQAQREALLGAETKESPNTTRAHLEAEFTKALRAHSEASTGYVEQDQTFDRHRLYSTRRWEASEEIHVMGCDLVGRYIACVLASCETIPPVRFLIHRMNIWKGWQKCGRRMLLERVTGPEVHNRIQAEFVSMKADPPLPGPLIRNLIVTVPPGSVVRALEPIKHRLDHRSTICLIHHGLGAAEAIIKSHFPDELTRPAFILGHMTTKLGHSELGERELQGGRFSVVELQQGRLYLSLLASKMLGPLARKHPPPERTLRFTNLLNLLMTVPDLNASSHPLPDLLRYKLPTIALISIAEPLAVILGVPYDELLKRQGTRKLMTDMLWEICHVVSKMPQCRNHERSQLSSLSTFVQKGFFLQLHGWKGKKPRTENQVHRAWDTDINYLTGYFVDRAAKLNVPIPNLRAVYKMRQAKRQIDIESIDNTIPFRDRDEGLVGDLAPLRS